jgi:hypothetical protein
VVRRQPWCLCWGPPSVSLPVFRAPLPSEPRKRRGNTALFRGANSWSVDTERLARDLAHRDFGRCFEEVRDAFFPGVGLIAGGVLRG